MRRTFRYFFVFIFVCLLFALALFVFRHSESRISDSLFFTGALTASFGVISALIERGELDSFFYIISRGTDMLLPRPHYRHMNLYEYKMEREKRRHAPRYFPILLGLPLIIASFILV